MQGIRRAGRFPGGRRIGLVTVLRRALESLNSFKAIDEMIKHTEEFKREAVRIALTSGLPRDRIASVRAHHSRAAQHQNLHGPDCLSDADCGSPCDRQGRETVNNAVLEFDLIKRNRQRQRGNPPEKR